MSQTDRVYRIERLIRQRGQVSFQQLIDELEVSRATLKRDLDYLRSRLGAPIVYDRFGNVYRFAEHSPAHSAEAARHELPGLWFSERELYSLLMAHQLLAGLDGEGLLGRHLQPLLERIHQMLGSRDGEAQALLARVLILSPARRPVPPRFFELVGTALAERRRLQMRYLTRGRRATGEREISPQRLVHYRSTWYVDAWCHRSEGLRRFALDAIEEATLLESAAKVVTLKQVQAAMDAGYGIWAGARRQWATLHFDAQAAQWVSREQWHPEQKGRALADGGWELKLPFAEPTELVMDVLRHGEQVRVVAPASLARAVAARLVAAAALYADEAGGVGVAPQPV